MSSFTKPIRPQPGQPVKAVHMDNHARAIEELQRMLKQEPIGKRRYRTVKPPFWPTLSGNDTDGYTLTMKKGWVSSTHWKYGVQSVVTIEVTSIPGDPDPVANALTVISGTKVYATLTENAYGEITAAVISSGVSWPTSSAAKLIGGDDQTGAAGTRYVRLCEIVTVDGSVKVKVMHTGNIEHSAPARVENTSNSISGNEARVVKVWNATEGRFDCRYLDGGTGITITENADSIEIKTNPSFSFPYAHPWKVTDAGSGNAAIAAGFVLGYYFELSTASPGASPATQQNFSPDSIVVGNGGTYAGGTLAITGTRYIYAEIPKNISGSTNEYAEASFVEDTDNIGATGIETIELFDEISPTLTDTATLVASASAPDAYTPTTNKAAVCIAKVTNAAGVITVDAQYLTHNPIVFIPVVGGIWEYP